MNLTDLMPHVLPNVSGCPSPTALFHIRQAAIEFCERTLVWQADLEEITSVADDDTYAMTFPTGSALVKLLAFTVDGDEASVVTADKGRRMALNDCGGDVAWTLDRVNLKVHPTPTVDGTVYGILAALKPTQTATTIADSLGEHYAADIAAGALAGLYRMKGVGWSDPVMATDRRDWFQRRIGVVAGQVSKGFGRGRRRVKVLDF